MGNELDRIRKEERSLEIMMNKRASSSIERTFAYRTRPYSKQSTPSLGSEPAAIASYLMGIRAPGS